LSPLAQRIADAVHKNQPRPFCFACLAAQEGVREHDVRAVALVLIVRAGLRLVQRVCSRCQRAGETLAARKLA
jgi:hypothetical protein